MARDDVVATMNSVVALLDHEEPTTPRAVALRPATAPRLPLPLAAELAALKEYGEIVIKSGMAPKHVTTWQAAVVIMRYGHQLGIDEFTALNNVYLINQRPACMASLLHGLIQRDHGDDAIVPVEIGTERVVLRCKRRTSRAVVAVTYTLDEARAAGLLTNQTWQKYPTDMLFARAISRAGRVLFRDSTLGMYTPEELGGNVIEVRGEIVETAPALSPIANGSGAPAGITQATMDKIHGEAARRAISQDELHAAAVHRYGVASMAALSENQGRQLLGEFRAIPRGDDAAHDEAKAAADGGLTEKPERGEAQPELRTWAHFWDWVATTDLDVPRAGKKLLEELIAEPLSVAPQTAREQVARWIAAQG